LYLLPVFAIGAWPAYRWLQKASSNNLAISKEEFSAFNSEEGEVRKAENHYAAGPELNDGVLNVSYRGGGSRSAVEELAGIAGGAEQRKAGAGRTARDSGAPADERERDPYGERTSGNGLKDREQRSIGFTEGLMAAVVEKVAHNPAALNAILSNKNIIGGFMSRDSVKAAGGSLQGLQNFLRTPTPMYFINNSAVKAAMSNPAIVNAVATSGLAGALMETPVARQLMNDPKALGDLFNSNPELVNAFMATPGAMTIMSNPEVAAMMSKFDSSAVK